MLVVGGRGFRFKVQREGQLWPAFVVRHSSGVAAYINRCSHLALELDWSQGTFFDIDKASIICSTHGALYEAVTGECIGGPCAGKPLETIQVTENDRFILLTDRNYWLVYDSPEKNIFSENPK
ncbi:MAG: (2Fe-2S)-binding protein [Acidiferrobacteraceae bacterium]|nr:(2Fe-2S)-binding protein [Acidiferrobacteraceae bacterium]